MNQTNVLLLVPTELERRQFVDYFSGDGFDSAELCGFGPVAAGIRTAHLIAQIRPDEVCLLGIAGCYANELEVGAAYRFDQVSIDGIGAGCGSQFLSTREINWPHWVMPDGEQVFDTISLSPTTNPPGRHLLTVTAASASVDEAFERQQRFSTSLAEDMESFAVALACRIANIPLTVIRGIANQAGDRNLENWHIESAIRAAGETFLANRTAESNCNRD